MWDFDLIGGRPPEVDLLAVAIDQKGEGEITPFSTPERTAFLRNLLKNVDFRNLFINRFADHINSTFNPKRTENLVMDVFKEAEHYDHLHRQRWNRNAITIARANRLINFLNARPDFQREHIRKHFDIEKNIDVTLQVNNPRSGHLRINTIEVHESTPGIMGEVYPWTGVYFSGIPVELEALPQQGRSFAGWQVWQTGAGEPSSGTFFSTNETITLTLNDDTTVKAVFR